MSGRLGDDGGFASDPAVPGRDRLLDPVRVGDRLGRLLGLPRRAPTLIRAKYRLGESLRVVYRLGGADRAMLVAARTFPPGASGDAHRAATVRAVPVGGVPGVVHDPGHDAVWWVLPNDRRLRGAGALLEPDAALARAAGLAGWDASEVAEYAPERSLTVRALDGAGRAVAYVKLYAPGTVDVARLADRYEQVATTLAAAPTGIRSPRALHVDPAHELLVLEPMPGRPWAAFSGDDAEAALRNLGIAVALVHHAPLDRGAAGLAPFGRLRPERLARSAALVACARGEVAAPVLALADRLAASRPPEPPLDATRVLHGDCHPKNALVAPGGIALIDLDQAGVGPAAADIGSLVARIRSGALVGEWPADHVEVMTEAFLAGYRSVAPAPSDPDLAWYGAAAMVAERAIRAVNRLHRPTLRCLPALVADAEAVLARSHRHPIDQSTRLERT